MKTTLEIMEKAYAGDYISSPEKDPIKDPDIDTDIDQPLEDPVTHEKSYKIWNSHPNTVLFTQFLQNLADLHQVALETTTNPNVAYLAGKHVALIKRIQHYAATGTDIYTATNPRS